jgi:hypothetical protein
MRAIARGAAHVLKWPYAFIVFAAQFLHHTAAFFAWAWVGLHIILPLATVGFSLSKIWTEAERYLNDGSIHWRGLLALALVPGTLVALRQGYLATRIVHPSHHHASQLVKKMNWPLVVVRFAGSLLHHTGAFFAWLWLLFALIGSVGQLGFHLTAVGEHTIKYFKSMGEDQWQVLLAASLIPALFTAAWSGRTAYRGLRAWADERPDNGTKSAQSA